MIVITGAAGMIGSGLVRHLNDLGRSDLILVDDLKKGGKWKNLLGKQFADLLSKHQILSYLQGKENEIEAILHMGACSDTMEEDGDYLLENNFRFTVRLATWALQANKRFIYASSAATYGDGSLGFSDEEALLSDLRPLNMYGYSKHLVDLWMQKEGAWKQGAVGLKYFNVFGPNEYHKGRMASMVLKMTELAQKEGVVRLYKSNDPARFADGEQVRDFIYLKDAVKMTCAFLSPPFHSIGGIFNIGLGVPTSWNTMAKALFDGLQRKTNIEYIEMPLELSRQYQNYTCADMAKFHKMLPGISLRPIASSVGEYVQEYLLTQARW